MNNKNIGALGEAFIRKRIDLGWEFDEAWDEWQQIEEKLMFAVVEHPEVQFYRGSDAEERLRLRRLAKLALGKDFRSADVDRLCDVASLIGVSDPVPAYHVDRQLVKELFECSADLEELESGFTDKAKLLRDSASSDEIINDQVKIIERFVNGHSLWTVPPRKLLGLYLRHRMPTYWCGSCGEELSIPIEYFENRAFRFTQECSACGSTNAGELLVHDGERYLEIEDENDGAEEQGR